jgi:hypothetical protein
VGGDYYDFLELADGRLGVAIGDISGKGIGAALMMANLEACLRGQAPSARDLPELVPPREPHGLRSILGQSLCHIFLCRI